MKDFDEPGSLAPTGLHLAGSKYMVIQGESGAVIRGKKVRLGTWNLPMVVFECYYNRSSMLMIYFIGCQLLSTNQQNMSGSFSSDEAFLEHRFFWVICVFIFLIFIHLTGHFWDHCKENKPSTRFWVIWWTHDSRTVQHDCREVGRLPDWSRHVVFILISFFFSTHNWDF